MRQRRGCVVRNENILGWFCVVWRRMVWLLRKSGGVLGDSRLVFWSTDAGMVIGNGEFILSRRAQFNFQYAI
jgi:hypothetical protein